MARGPCVLVSGEQMRALRAKRERSRDRLHESALVHRKSVTRYGMLEHVRAACS